MDTTPTTERSAYYLINARGFANTGYYQAIPERLAKIAEKVLEVWRHVERLGCHTNADFERVTRRNISATAARNRRLRKALPNDLYRNTEIEAYRGPRTLGELLAEICGVTFGEVTRAGNLDYLDEETLEAIRKEGVELDNLAKYEIA